jgi:hypothetical protein
MNDLALQSLGKQFYDQSETVIQSLLQEEQIPCPLIHRFGAGMYIREAHYPAGSVIIGHKHRLPQLNIFVKGRLKMLNPDGTVTEMVAPMTFIGDPGRKFAVMLEDVIWQNVWPTNKTDIDEVEADCYDMPQFHFDRLVSNAPKALPGPQSSLPDVLTVPMPPKWNRAIDRKAPDGGRGFFATVPVAPGQPIAPLLIDGKYTPARYARCSEKPNAKALVAHDGVTYLVAIEPLAGCIGGDLGTEVLIEGEQE